MSPELQKKIDELETIYKPFEMRQRIVEICQLAEKENEKDLLNNMRFEYLLWNLISHLNDNKDRFKPLFGFVNDKGEEVLSANPDDFSPEAFEYFNSQLNKTKNPVRLARYADFLWEKYRDEAGKRNIQSVLAAIDAYLECSKLFLGSLNATKSIQNQFQLANELADSTVRSIALADQIGNQEKLESALESALAVMDSMVETEYSGLVLHISYALRGTKYSGKTDLPNTLKALLERGKVYFESKTDHSEVVIKFLEQLIAVAKLQKGNVEVKKLNVEIGETLVKAAEWKGAHYPSGKMVEAGMLEMAFKHFSNIGESSRLDELKIKIKKAQQNAQSEYGSFEVPFEITKDEIEGFFNAYKNAKPDITAEEYLIILATHKNMRFKLESAKKEVEKYKQDFPLMAIMPRRLIANDNTVHSTNTDELQNEILLCDQWNNFRAILGAYLHHYFRHLFDNLGLTAERLAEFLGDREFLKPKKTIIQTAVKLLALGDYLSFIHLIVPHIEDILRSFLVPLNEPTTATQAGVYREIDLKQVLDNPKMVQVFGEDLIYSLKMLLVDVRGANLRNRVGHGIINLSECNPANAALLLHLLVILASYSTKNDVSAQNP